MKELNQKEMEQVSGAGLKELLEGIVHVAEQIGEGIVTILEETGVVSKETGETIKKGMGAGEKILDGFFETIL
ncbi:hypothetical protein ACP179_02625 [Xenorhabdus stockiae]|uniref:hypothetical protein n=1 Tax=Xenorhabdus stockiae TaxID=351614 RepID=UPI003CEF106D